MRDKSKVKEVWNAPKYFLTLIFISFLVLAAQLSYVALSPVIYGIDMDEFAQSRNTYSKVLYAKRGTFYDSDGNVLAQNVSSYTVIAYLSSKRTVNENNPQHVVDKLNTAKVLAPILNMTEERLLELLNKNVYQVELGPGGRGITELVKGEIQDLKLPGIDFVETYKRFYPNGNFASYILGYAKKYSTQNDDGTITDSIVGELGLEAKYNEMLTGKNGYLKYQQDRFGYKIPDTAEERIEAVDGNDIYLTLNSNIQRFAESSIKDMANKYSPKWATVSVMEAKTGNILAAATVPSFDPNIKDITNYQSPLVTYAIEPGSTMKIFSYLCAVDSGKYNSSFQVKTGSIKIGDDEVRDWNRVGWGIITLDQGLLYSSNVAASSLINNVITKQELRECYEKLGFGSETDIELANESKGKISFNYPIEVATATFGQGVMVTVMQQLQAMSVLANDGQIVSPHIVDKIVDPNTNKVVYESSVTKSEKLFKTSSVEYIKNLLYESVNGTDPNATGRYYKVDGYDVLGKTGTAQIASTTGGYLQGANDYISSFLGMYPKNDPKLIIYIAVQQPTWGLSSSVSGILKEMVTNMTKYLNLFDDGTNISSVEKIVLDSYLNQNVDVVSNELLNKKVNVIKIGNGDKIIKQYPKKDTVILSNDKLILLTNDKNITIPDLKGYSLKEASNLLNMLGIKVCISGTGYVVEQSITPGEIVTDNMEIMLTLSDKYDLDNLE